jgi:hypothetical protein
VNTIMDGVPADKYHADPCEQPSLSSSIAKILLTQSPMHAWLAHPRLNPKYRPDESSRFDLGSAAHALLLEGEDRMVVVDASDWRTKAAQAERDDARTKGMFPILRHQFHDVTNMVQEARKFIASTELAGIFENCKAEQTCVWTDGEIHCRARLDWLTDDRLVILDYKSTDDARPETFIRQIARMGYDLQAEFYVKAVEECAQVSPTFVFLAQEITAPYSCSLVGLSNAYREIGKAKVGGAMDRWARSISSGKWPAYSAAVHYAEPSAWQVTAMETGEYL